MGLFDVLAFIGSHPLTRDRRLRAGARLVAWQVRSRLTSGDVVHEWVNGSRFLVRRGETGLTGNIYTGLHEFPDMAFVLHALRPDDLFVDVGANVGSYTVLACAAIGARGYAFEPVPATFARLVENVRLNDLRERVVCLHQAVGAEPGRVAFFADRDTENRVLAPGDDGDAAATVEVTVAPLDAALAGEAPVVMKIDVEGYERAVLDGAVETLARPSLLAVILEMNASGTHYGFDAADVPERMARHGFRPYTYEPFSRALTPAAGGSTGSGNTLFVRDAVAVARRLTSAPAFVIDGRRI